MLTPGELGESEDLGQQQQQQQQHIHDEAGESGDFGQLSLTPDEAGESGDFGQLALIPNEAGELGKTPSVILVALTIAANSAAAQLREVSKQILHALTDIVKITISDEQTVRRVLDGQETNVMQASNENDRAMTVYANARNAAALARTAALSSNETAITNIGNQDDPPGTETGQNDIVEENKEDDRNKPPETETVLGCFGSEAQQLETQWVMCIFEQSLIQVDKSDHERLIMHNEMHVLKHEANENRRDLLNIGMRNLADEELVETKESERFVLLIIGRAYDIGSVTEARTLLLVSVLLTILSDEYRMILYSIKKHLIILRITRIRLIMSDNANTMIVNRLLTSNFNETDVVTNPKTIDEVVLKFDT